MAKKKSKKSLKSSSLIVEEKDSQPRRMKPTEWAKEDKIDYHLFLHWENQLMTRDEFEKLKEKILA